MKRIIIALFLVLAIGCATGLLAQGECPPDTECIRGQDEAGAYYFIAVPANYNNRLVLWNHGYDLAPPQPLLRLMDLGYGSLLLNEGFAVAASSYRSGGWVVADGAADTENLRKLFVETYGQPDYTYVVGASEGGIITAAIAELYGTDANGNLQYNGALPMCGPLAGGRRNFYGAFDLRVVYQYYCRNLPRPTEPQYELYLGLRPGDTLTQPELYARINECTGIDLPPGDRSTTQRANLANILNVAKIPEGFLKTDLSYATFAMAELVQGRTRGGSPVTNLGVMYSGSTDDAALNRDVYRHGSDPDAVEYIRGSYDTTGVVPMPTLTIHTIGDGLVIVENERAYRELFKGDDLFQTYTLAPGHCQFTFSEFEAVFHALQEWVVDGTRPSHDRVLALCNQYRAIFGDSCNFNPTYQPNPLETRILPRDP
ncbi:MAG: hypothetical protein HYR55_06975 [Acidobacteria bacterium]|nr:hypothetical protein [Acidobacteriota bacterium]MBI3656221.1 hypothetical protein [Acidobacteriota bacterium]